MTDVQEQGRECAEYLCSLEGIEAESEGDMDECRSGNDEGPITSKPVRNRFALFEGGEGEGERRRLSIPKQCVFHSIAINQKLKQNMTP